MRPKAGSPRERSRGSWRLANTLSRWRSSWVSASRRSGTGSSATSSRGLTRRHLRPRLQAEEVVRVCSTHGETRFVLEGRGYYRCSKCRLLAVSEWRRRTKARLVAEKGGRCMACGYNRYSGALQFHHLDRTTKEFSLSVRGLTRSVERIRSELTKCILLCANCCAEIEAGLIEAPPPRGARWRGSYRRRRLFWLRRSPVM